MVYYHDHINQVLLHTHARFPFPPSFQLSSSRILYSLLLPLLSFNYILSFRLSLLFSLQTSLTCFPFVTSSHVFSSPVPAYHPWPYFILSINVFQLLSFSILYLLPHLFFVCPSFHSFSFPPTLLYVHPIPLPLSTFVSHILIHATFLLCVLLSLPLILPPIPTSFALLFLLFSWFQPFFPTSLEIPHLLTFPLSILLYT